MTDNFEKNRRDNNKEFSKMSNNEHNDIDNKIYNTTQNDINNINNNKDLNNISDVNIDTFKIENQLTPQNPINLDVIPSTSVIDIDSSEHLPNFRKSNPS